MNSGEFVGDEIQLHVTYLVPRDDAAPSTPGIAFTLGRVVDEEVVREQRQQLSADVASHNVEQNEFG